MTDAIKLPVRKEYRPCTWNVIANDGLIVCSTVTESHADAIVAVFTERERMREALQKIRFTYSQDEIDNIIDAALRPQEPTNART